MKSRKSTAHGLSLIELMVSLVIGSILIIGAVTVYVQSRKTYAVNEAMARLQENARYALSMIEPDLRLASHWGLTNDPVALAGRVDNDPLDVPGGAAVCGATFPIDLLLTVDGANDASAWPLACAPTGGARDTSDLLIVRRASTQVTPAAADRLQVFTTLSGNASRVFDSGAAPATAGEVRDLIVRAYYISNESSLRNDLPSLRRKDLVAGPSIQDEEIMPGIEDLQVQFGVDPGLDSDGDGIVDVYSGRTTQYVNPGSPALANALVNVVRVWILVRAENPEVGFTDNNSYSYGDVANYQPNDGFRRLLVSRTIQIRNTQI